MVRAYTGICRLSGDQILIENLMLRIMRENESLHDDSQVLSDYCCVIYRNIMHVWPEAFGTDFSLSPDSSRGLINLMMRRATQNWVDEHLIATCSVLKRIHDSMDSEETLSIVAFEMTVSVCNLIGGTDDREFERRVSVLPVVCHHISWRDTYVLVLLTI
jgi:hypothetical protein